MDMNKEDFVSLECAKLLKEKGFEVHWSNRYVIPIKGTEREEWDEEECMMCTKTDCEIYPKPTIYEAAKWLRDTHDIHVDMNCYAKDNCDCTIMSLDGSFCDKGLLLNTTYESALNAGIIEALKLIGERV